VYGTRSGNDRQLFWDEQLAVKARMRVTAWDNGDWHPSGVDNLVSMLEQAIERLTTEVQKLRQAIERPTASRAAEEPGTNEGACSVSDGAGCLGSHRILLPVAPVKEGATIQKVRLRGAVPACGVDVLARRPRVLIGAGLGGIKGDPGAHGYDGLATLEPDDRSKDSRSIVQAPPCADDSGSGRQPTVSRRQSRPSHLRVADNTECGEALGLATAMARASRDLSLSTMRV
jgi:hypothetical protein